MPSSNITYNFDDGSMATLVLMDGIISNTSIVLNFIESDRTVTQYTFNGYLSIYNVSIHPAVIDVTYQVNNKGDFSLVINGATILILNDLYVSLAGLSSIIEYRSFDLLFNKNVQASNINTLAYYDKFRIYHFNMTKNEDMGVPGVFYHDRLYGKALYSIDINLNRDLSRFIANNGKHNVCR